MAIVAIWVSVGLYASDVGKLVVGLTIAMIEFLVAIACFATEDEPVC
jgi:hypothetical protein